MATALLIGGSGQIGRAAVPALVADGWDVRVLTRDAGHGAQAAAWGAEPVVGDRHDADALDRALGTGTDVLVDVVAYDDTDAAPLLARRDRIGSAVVVSSAAVYVDADGDGFETEEWGTFPVPVTEDQPTVEAGRSSYATGKLALERAWLAADDVPTTVLRPGAIHGPGCRQPREWTFVKRWLDGRDVRVLAYDGESRFHTTSTLVLAELVRLAAARPGHRVLNAVDPEALTVAEIGEAVDDALGARTRTVTVAGPPVDDVGLTPWCVPRPMVLDMALAARSLGYVAPGGYAQTVRPAVEWLVERARAGDWRAAFPGFARMEAMGDFFPYAAEDRFLSRLGGQP